MSVNQLKLPEQLTSLLNAGIWPRNSTEANRQNMRSLFDESLNNRYRSIFLYPPPFQILSEIFQNDKGLKFYQVYGAIHELSPDKMIVIGDFGLGSDSPILLDYTINETNPRVIYLEWPGKISHNYWAELAPDFTSFVAMMKSPSV